MKNLTKAAVVLAAVALVSQAAQANPGDLIFGITSSSAGVTSDYIIDLGSLATLNSNPLMITQLGGLINLGSTFPGGSALNAGAAFGLSSGGIGDALAI